jgi:hypothetical protein
MLTQVLEQMFPGEPYTSDGTTWESVVFEDATVSNLLTDETYEYTLYKLTNVEAIKQFREERNALLDKSDKYVTPDYPHRLELDIQNWKDYRLALRHLPGTAKPTLDKDGNLKDVVWPTPPTTLTGGAQDTLTQRRVSKLVNENTKLSSKITALERRSTDQELKLIRLSKLLEK